MGKLLDRKNSANEMLLSLLSMLWLNYKISDGNKMRCTY